MKKGNDDDGVEETSGDDGNGPTVVSSFDTFCDNRDTMEL